MKIRKAKEKCCEKPDPKFLSKRDLDVITNHNYVCYNCRRTWTEFEIPVDILKKL